MTDVSTIRCPIEFKPADRAGQSMTSISSWSKYPMTTLALCLGHYLESGWNMARQNLRKVSQLAVGLYLDTLRLLEHPYQWLANPYGHPEKFCPQTIRTHLRISRIQWCCTQRNALRMLRAFPTPLHVGHTWIHKSATRLWRVEDSSDATANPGDSGQNSTLPVWCSL